VTDTAEMSKMSEKDLLYVLDIVKKDYNVDEKRVYLLGHSLGGGGAIYLGRSMRRNGRGWWRCRRGFRVPVHGEFEVQGTAADDIGGGERHDDCERAAVGDEDQGVEHCA